LARGYKSNDTSLVWNAKRYRFKSSPLTTSNRL
jgi:hypothetical protein